MKISNTIDKIFLLIMICYWGFDKLYPLKILLWFLSEYIRNSINTVKWLVHLLFLMQELKIVETSDWNPSGMCISKNKNNWRHIDFDQIG
jgi:hypothetical protein